MDNFTVIPLWSHPFYMTKLEVGEQLKDDMVKYMSQPSNIERPEGNDGNCSIDKHILNQFPTLKDKIFNEVEKYIYDIIKVKRDDNYKFYFTTSWINQNKPNDWGPLHWHRNSLFSGVYYFKQPKDFQNAGALKIVNGNHTSCGGTIEFDYTEQNSFNTKEWNVIPQEDLLVIFPSSTRHSIDMNRTSEDRYSLAFNVWVEGTIGNHITELKMKGI